MHSRIRHLRGVAALTALGTTLSGVALADGSLAVGYDRSVGDYGQSDTTTIDSVSLALGWRIGRWSLKGTTTGVTMYGPDTLVLADGATSSGSGSGVMVRQTGQGDSYLSLKRALPFGERLGLYLDLGLKVKLPTGDVDKGLSTGEVDYTAQLDLSWARGEWMPMFGVGYRVPGQSDSYAPEPVWLASLGLHKRMGGGGAGVIYDYRQAYTTYSEAVSEAMLYRSLKVGEAHQWTLYLSTGFTDNSIDAGAGLQYRYAWR